MPGILRVLSRVHNPEGEEVWLGYVFYLGFRGHLLKAYCVSDPELGFEGTDKGPCARGLSVQAGDYFLFIF